MTQCQASSNRQMPGNNAPWPDTRILLKAAPQVIDTKGKLGTQDRQLIVKRLGHPEKTNFLSLLKLLMHAP